MGRSKLFGWRKSVAGESGSQLVELALVLPIFLFVTFAIGQYGILFMSYIAARNASSVGGRQAIISPSDTNAIRSVATAAAGPLLDTSKVQVVVAPATLSTGVGTTVTVSYPLTLIVPYVVPPFSNGSRVRTITAVTTVH
jgi:Flp pilus assembly protein TadG